MNYFFDTEFMESPGTLTFMSLAMIREDGARLYAESRDFDPEDANDWVKENVVPHLKWRTGKRQELILTKETVNDLDHWNVYGTNDQIADVLREFISKERDSDPIFWSYYADYDWVAFCQLFGSMIELPKHFPMYCKDVMQLLDDIDGYDDRPEQKGTEHDPMADAEYHMALYEYAKKKIMEGTYDPFNIG
jgi:hypothetical protein